MQLSFVTLAAALALANAQTNQPTFSTIEPNLSQIAATAATAPVASYKGDVYVPGKAFDRIFTVFFENQDYSVSLSDPHFQELSKLGITLTNYFALTHTSEPNYLASAAGDYFGLPNDYFMSMPSNISSVVDLLDTKGISWSEYQQAAPYAGYQGYNFSNQATYANDYMRKHNPLILFDSVVSNTTRLSNIKNFTGFNQDIASQSLPQWSFITPNMTNDAHDTNITVAGDWAFSFFEPLLTNNSYFTNNTLLILTFDENASYEKQNQVLTLLLGDIPEELKGTTDNTFYDHYSLLSSVQANWGLPNLGRFDCGANVFEIIANKTGYTNKPVDTSMIYNNQSLPGWLADQTFEIPAPNCNCMGAGGPVLQAVVDAWGSVSTNKTNLGFWPGSYNTGQYYSEKYVTPNTTQIGSGYGSGPNAGSEGPSAQKMSNGTNSTTPSSNVTATSSPTAVPTKNAAAGTGVSVVFAGVIALLASLL